MTRGTDIDLIRLLHGELTPDEARELRERLGREPDLATSYRRLERAWSGLALPPPSPVPAGFAGRVMAHVRSQPALGTLSWSAAPGLGARRGGGGADRGGGARHRRRSELAGGRDALRLLRGGLLAVRT